jgi:hypothetical protein
MRILVSATLYVLVVLQGANGLTFSPGYTTAAECVQQYKGPNVACFNYDPEGASWTAFFKLPDGGFRVVRRIPNEGECRRYIDAFKSDIPAACRQLAQPDTCNVACIKSLELPPPAAKPGEPDPTPPPPVPQAAPPDPASLNTKPSDIQVGGKQYTKVAGLTWIEKQPPNSFADVSVGPNDLQSKNQPSSLPQTARAEAPKKRVVAAQGPHYYDRAPQPLQAFIDTVMLPFDFLSYPGRRDW